MMLRHPFAGLGGVVDGVARLLVDIDAAGEILVALAGELLQLLLGGGAIHAGDQHALRLALGEQLHRLVDAVGAAGQHGDAVGRALRLARLALDARREHGKADEEEHHEEQHAIEDEPAPPRRSR